MGEPIYSFAGDHNRALIGHFPGFRSRINEQVEIKATWIRFLQYSEISSTL